jgi:heat shock protein 5
MVYKSRQKGRERTKHTYTKHRVDLFLAAMVAGGDRRLAATLQALIFAWLLGAASGLQVHDYPPSMYADITPEEFWYPPASVVAIDLGNTNSCVAGYAPGKTVPTTFCIPSWVAFTDDGTVLVGEAARNHAGAHPESAVFGFKRLLGLR